MERGIQMRAAATEHLEASNFHSVNGTAEATALDDASVQFVTAAQAFHWFDPDRARSEFHRILSPGGVIVLVWNDRRLEDSAFNRAYQQLIERFHVDHSAVRSRDLLSRENATLARFFGPGGYECRTFDNPQILDRRRLIDRLASASYMPLPPNPQHERMLHAADQIFDAHHEDGKVLISHNTLVYFGKLSV